MYKNLERMMKERKVTKKEIAEHLQVRHATIVDKTNGHSRFYLDEAMHIQKNFFPDVEIEYLFSTE